MKLSRFAAVLVVALALVVGQSLTASSAFANAKPDDKKQAQPVEHKKQEAAPVAAEPAVVIDAGTVTSETTIDISADGGTAISDASGGDDNFAFTTADAAVVADDDGGPRSVLDLRDELVGGGEAGNGGDVAAAGNGGTAEAAANGGAIAIGDINSGGNSGNAIVVGDTNAAPAPEKPKEEPKKPVAPKPVAPKPEAPKKVEAPKAAPAPAAPAPAAAPAARGGDRVRNLPSTGTGVAGDAGTNGALLTLATVAGLAAAGFALRRRSA